MKVTLLHLSSAILASAMAVSASGQTPKAATGIVPNPVQVPAPGEASAAQTVTSPAPGTRAVVPAVPQLLAFTDSEVKFNLPDLMEILRDRRHEGWVLAAYPDPKTGHPLIGAGFSLDLPAREHPQTDPLNPHPFIEPSSAELWQAAGLDPDRLQSILDQYDNRLAAWAKWGFRKRIKTLTPEISDEEANLLLRVAAIQAIYNARGYCRNFDGLAASQQMALSQLVYQMGVNLREFSQFLDLINNNSGSGDTTAAPLVRTAVAVDADYWKTVQKSLVQSQWARLYRARAVSVIAMLDPQYADGPRVAEQRVGAMLRPTVVHRRTARSGASRQLASGHLSKGRPSGKARSAKIHSQRKRKT
jgi:hypothetical protein